MRRLVNSMIRPSASRSDQIGNARSGSRNLCHSNTEMLRSKKPCVATKLPGAIVAQTRPRDMPCQVEETRFSMTSSTTSTLLAAIKTKAVTRIGFMASFMTRAGRAGRAALRKKTAFQVIYFIGIKGSAVILVPAGPLRAIRYCQN